MNMTPDEQPQPVASELLPCPFCGSAASRQTTQRRHDFFDAVECTNELCGVFIVADEHGQDEIKKWNTRAHPPTSAASQPDAVRVTDEMVERAMQAYYRAYNDDGYTRKIAIRSAIEAALNPPAESSAREETAPPK